MRRRLLAALMLAGIAGCAAQGSDDAFQPSLAASESAVVLVEALRGWLPETLGARDLDDWVLVVDAGTDSRQVVELMGHPSFTTQMPPDIEVRPVGSVDRQSGRSVMRFCLRVSEVSNECAYVTAEYDCGTRCGGADRVELAPGTSGWRVISFEVLWRN